MQKIKKKKTIFDWYDSPAGIDHITNSMRHDISNEEADKLNKLMKSGLAKTNKRKVVAPMPTKNKKIFHGKSIDVESISKDMDKLMANSITTNPIPAPDLRKRIDPDLSKGLGNLKDYIPEDF